MTAEGAFHPCPHRSLARVAEEKYAHNCVYKARTSMPVPEEATWAATLPLHLLTKPHDKIVKLGTTLHRTEQWEVLDKEGL